MRAKLLGHRSDPVLMYYLALGGDLQRPGMHTGGIIS